MKTKLSPSESAIRMIDQSAPFNLQGTLSIEGEVDEKRIQRALTELQKSHPLLNIQLQDLNIVECHKPIPLKKIERHSDNDWVNIAEDELNLSTVTSESPLMRVVWVKGTTHHELIFTINHTICDGKSTGALLKEFLNIYTHNVSQVINPDEGRDPESYLSEGFSFTPEPVKLDTLENNIYDGQSTQVLRYTFDKETTDKLVQQKNVHGILCAAMVMHISQRLENSKETIQCMTSTDIRRFLSAGDTLGYFVSCLWTECGAEVRSDLKTLAKFIKDDLRHQVKTGAPLKAFASLTNVLKQCDTSAKFINFIKLRAPTVGVTNAGVVDFDVPNLPFEIRDTHMGTGMPKVWDNPNAFFMGVHIFNGRMQLSLFITRPTVTLENAQDMLNGVIEILRAHAVNMDIGSSLNTNQHRT